MKKYLLFMIVAIALIGTGLYVTVRPALSTMEIAPTRVSTTSATVPSARPNLAQQGSTSVQTEPRNGALLGSGAVSSLQSQPPLAPTATVSIEGKGHLVSISSAHPSVLDAMNVLAATGTVTFSGSDYPSLGFFVESINGKKNADGYYWFLYVNGKSSDTGASQTTLKPGDTVEWRYEKSQ